MNANQFKEVIRKLVIEEVRKEVSSQLPKLLFEMIGQQPRTVVREQKQVVRQPVVRQPIPNDGSDPDSEPIRQQAPQPKVIKRYAKDPKLNAILNETTPGLPVTPYSQGVPIGVPDFDKVGVSDEFMGEMRQLMNEGSDPQPQQEVVEERSSGPDLSKLFNKNFKAILEKSKGRTGGGLGTSVIQNW
jgi:hypothetical protein